MTTEIPKIDICTLSGNREEDILVSRFSEYFSRHSNLAAPHRHSFYHLLFFTEGGGRHTIDFHHFEVKPRQIYFMVPGQVHSWDFEGKMEGYIVNFSEAFFKSFLLRQDYLDSFSFLRGYPENSVLDLGEEVGTNVAGLFEKLIDAEVFSPGYRDDFIRTVLLQVFIVIQNSIESGKEMGELPKGNLWLRNYQKLIEQHFLTLRLPGEYAAILHITPNHLNALCKEQLGIKAGQLIRDRVILEAKRLLINVDLSVSEIAYKLNYKDNSYFSRSFKKAAGMTPEEFRRKHVH